MKYPTHLLKLIESFKMLPGVGNKSAERFAFHLINQPPEQLSLLANIIHETPLRLKTCPVCGCLIGEASCPFCEASRSTLGVICIVASARDTFAIEATHEYRGLYHVLGGLLSPMEGIGPEKLTIESLKQRIRSLQIKEVVIALDSTLEGDATALYLKQELADLSVQMTRLAFGLPMGSALDYVDGGTLARAFSGRSRF